MKTKKLVPLYSHNRAGEVKVVNALATIHKILDEIAPSGRIHCSMTTTDKSASFRFSRNGVTATFHIEEGGRA